MLFSNIFNLIEEKRHVKNHVSFVPSCRLLGGEGKVSLQKETYIKILILLKVSYK